MQRALSSLIAIAWGLWFGGLITLFMAVMSLFRTFHPDRALAGAAAADIFRRFERYQLGLAAAALVVTFAWRLMPGAPRLKTALFAVFALATLLALTSTAYITPQIQEARQQGQTETAEFKRLHGISAMLYVGEAAVLLANAFLMPFAIRRDGPGDQSPGRS